MGEIGAAAGDKEEEIVILSGRGREACTANILSHKAKLIMDKTPKK